MYDLKVKIMKALIFSLSVGAGYYLLAKLTLWIMLEVVGI